MEWTDEIISRLQTLWREGLSTAEIGRQLSITKNAVVGKAHRLGLPPRPSPIRAGAKTTKELLAEGDLSAGSDLPSESVQTDPAAPLVQSPEAVTANTAPVGSGQKSVSSATPVVQTVTVDPTDKSAPVAARPTTARKQAEAKTMAPDSMLRPMLRPLTAETSPRRGPSCCWPNGDPGTPGFHFCGAKPVAGKPYCAEHCAVAYVKLRDRRDTVG